LVLEPAVAFMRLLNGHQVRDLDPILVGVDEIERGERSPYMEAEYLRIIRVQAFFISPATRIRIDPQSGKFCRDDALRLLRQGMQEVRRRLPEQNGERHNGISTSSSVSWIRLISSTSRRFFSCSIISSISSEKVIPGPRMLERSAQTSSLTIMRFVAFMASMV